MLAVVWPSCCRTAVTLAPLRMSRLAAVCRRSSNRSVAGRLARAAGLK
jgi:hypothetical protein